jgi:hypothetical protein
LEPADPAVPDEFGHAMIDGDGAILGAGLKDPAMAADGFDEDLAFVDGERWFLALNILAGAQGEHAHEGVPMVGVEIMTASMSSRASTSRKSLVIAQSWLRYCSSTISLARRMRSPSTSQTTRTRASLKFR